MLQNVLNPHLQTEMYENETNTKWNHDETISQAKEVA